MYKSCTSNYCEFLEEMGFLVRKLYMIRSPYMKHVSVISRHLIFTGFHRLTGCQRDSRGRGVIPKGGGGGGGGEPGREKREGEEMGLGPWAGPWAFKFS